MTSVGVRSYVPGRLETMMIVEKVYYPLTVNGTRLVILKVEGIIKISESAEFFAVALEITAVRNPNMIVDFGRIDYLDSTGFGELVGVCVRLARLGTNFVILNPPDDRQNLRPDRLQKLLRLAHAEEDVRALENLEDAITAVVASAAAN